MTIPPRIRTIERLYHILESITLIEQFSKGGLKISDVMQTSAIYYQLLIIGEATRHMEEKYKEIFSDIPWKRIIAMRNYLVHEYFAIHQDKIQAAIDDIPKIKERIQEILKILEEDENC